MSTETVARNAGHEGGSRRAALVFVIIILAFGVCGSFLHLRTPDFGGEHAFYADAARNLLEHGVYEVNGRAETTQPPGLPLILAALFAAFGYSFGVCLAAMALFETLGFLAAYELLRRRVGNVVAGMICIVLMSAPEYFGFATRDVYACFPYFFTTMIALLCGEKYERAETVRSGLMWGAAFTLAVVASLLVATGTIALLGAMLMVVLATARRDRRLARARLLRFLPVLLAGALVQGAWMQRTPAPPEWPLPGHPASYLQQMKLLDGNYPELGMVTWRDIPARVARNVMAWADKLTTLALRHGINQTRVAVLAIPVLLIVAGWAYSVRIRAGGDLVAWYLAGYSLIYLLWPWRMEARFILPIAPLACLYAWQGLAGLRLASKAWPRAIGILWSIVALALALAGVHSLRIPRQTGHGDLPDWLAVLMWLASAAGGLWMAWMRRPLLTAGPLTGLSRLWRMPIGSWRVGWRQVAGFAGCALAAGLVLAGLWMDVGVARENLNKRDLTSFDDVRIGEILRTEVRAGAWLRLNTSATSVAMARHWPTVYHHSNRRLIWFPPISDPAVLFEGIVRHRVDYVVVVRHAQPYYLPDDDDCFDRLLAVHPETFQLTMREKDLRIFKVQRVAHAGVPG